MLRGFALRCCYKNKISFSAEEISKILSLSCFFDDRHRVGGMRAKKEREIHQKAEKERRSHFYDSH